MLVAWRMSAEECGTCCLVSLSSSAATLAWRSDRSSARRSYSTAESSPQNKNGHSGWTSDEIPLTRQEEAGTPNRVLALTSVTSIALSRRLRSVRRPSAAEEPLPGDTHSPLERSIDRNPYIRAVAASITEGGMSCRCAWGMRLHWTRETSTAASAAAPRRADTRSGVDRWWGGTNRRMAPASSGRVVATEEGKAGASHAPLYRLRRGEGMTVANAACAATSADAMFMIEKNVVLEETAVVEAVLNPIDPKRIKGSPSWCHLCAWDMSRQQRDMA